MRGPVRPRTVEDNETLLAAGEAGDADAVRALLGTGVAPAIACKDAALLAAAFTGHAACARALLDAGTSAGAERDGDTALMVAGIVGHAECLRALVAPGARVDDGGCGSDAALILASHVGHAKCVRVLLAAGARMNLPGGDDCTALAAACSRGQRRSDGAVRRSELRACRPVRASVSPPAPTSTSAQTDSRPFCSHLGYDASLPSPRGARRRARRERHDRADHGDGRRPCWLRAHAARRRRQLKPVERDRRDSTRRGRRERAH